MTALPEALLRRLEWHVVRRLDGRLQGGHRTVFRGPGIDVAGLRPYAAEDDVRHIDWNVTARLDEPYVRQYLQDRELTAWLVLDRSASMRFGTVQGKDSVVADLAVSLARLHGTAGDRVGAVLYDNASHRVVPPGTGRRHVLRLIHEITAPSVARTDGRPTDLAGMLHLAAATIRRRGLVFVVSDFIGSGDWSSALVRLGQRHEVVAVRVVDPAELTLPDVGVVLVQDAETGEQLVADTSDPLLRQRFADQVAAREAELHSAMHRPGVSAHTVTTDTDLVEALVGMARASRRPA